MWQDAVVTNQGLNAIAQYTGGAQLTVTKATAGSGTYPAVSLANAEALKEEKQELTIVNYKVTDENNVQYKLQFGPNTAAYTANQIGIWGHVGTGEDVLLAIYQDDNGISVPDEDDNPDFLYAFYAMIQMDGTGDLTVTVDTSAAVTEAEMEDAIAEAKADVKALEGTGYIKFPDGTMICYGGFSLPAATYESFGAMYAHDYDVQIPYAVSFVGSPSLSVICNQHFSGIINHVVSTNAAITSVSVVRQSGGAVIPIDNPGLKYIAIGRWK